MFWEARAYGPKFNFNRENMDQVDLNIDNYTLQDVMDFLGIDRGNYDAEIVDRQVGAMYDRVLILPDVDRTFRRDFGAFLRACKSLLLQARYGQPSPPIPEKAITGVATGPRGHPIVSNPATPFVYANPSEFFHGTMNPLDKRICTRVVSVETMFRENYYSTKSTDFTFRLPEPLTNVASMQLVSMELPRMWYEVSAAQNNNYFTVSLYNMSLYADATIVVIVPDGNYSPVEFSSVLTNYFNSVKMGLDYLVAQVNLTNSRTVIRAKDASDGGDGPFPFDSSLPGYSPNFRFEVDFMTDNDLIYQNLGWMMGFRKYSYAVDASCSYVDNINFTDGAITFYAYLESEASYGSTASDYVYLEIDDYNRNCQTNTFMAFTSQDSYMGGNIIARIPMFKTSFHTIYDTSKDRLYKLREYFGGVRIEKMRIRLLDRYGKPINLGYNDYSFSLEFKQVYDSGGGPLQR